MIFCDMCWKKLNELDKSSYDLIVFKFSKNIYVLCNKCMKKSYVQDIINNNKAFVRKR